MAGGSVMSRRAAMDLAEELPDYQTARGAEFRNTNRHERLPIAEILVGARSQVEASEADFDERKFRSALRRKKETFVWTAGCMEIDFQEAQSIWQNVVYENVEVSTPDRI